MFTKLSQSRYEPIESSFTSIRSDIQISEFPTVLTKWSECLYVSVTSVVEFKDKGQLVDFFSRIDFILEKKCF